METDLYKAGVVSIIIPVYNSKHRLALCLDSVAAQSYPNTEVIIVDDCSTDGSLELCREYEKKYLNFHVYTKGNEGVSAARNYGMQKASGEYLQFADSDDELLPDMCERLVARMEEDRSDLVICGYYNEKEQRENTCPDGLFESRKEWIVAFPLLFAGMFLHVPWNKLYRRECVDARFPADLNKGEDLLFNLQVFSQADRISVMDKCLYRYHNVEEQSLSFRFREDAMEIEERLFLSVMDFYTEQGGGEPSFLYRFYLDAVKNKFYALLGKSGFDRKRCCEVIREWVGKESIRRLYRQREIFGGKDRILLFLMYRKWVKLLYRYYAARV
ncbi:MAG: glycosyltransferase [Eubacterium sp.]|jgi:glycosyltransferase involved in cell wall biosynthesis|nr:glycosyltransferase [Eubacterium sp.]